jgi:hypothetical protein
VCHGDPWCPVCCDGACTATIPPGFPQDQGFCQCP